MADQEYYYRIFDQQRACSLDDNDNPIPGTGYTSLQCDRLKVVKYTPKGVRLQIYAEKTVFVLNNSRKKYACPTYEEAVTSFVARKQRQRRIYRSKLAHIDEALDKAAVGDITKLFTDHISDNEFVLC